MSKLDLVELLQQRKKEFMHPRDIGEGSKASVVEVYDEAGILEKLSKENFIGPESVLDKKVDLYMGNPDLLFYDVFPVLVISDVSSQTNWVYVWEMGLWVLGQEWGIFTAAMGRARVEAIRLTAGVTDIRLSHQNTTDTTKYQSYKVINKIEWTPELVRRIVAVVELMAN